MVDDKVVIFEKNWTIDSCDPAAGDVVENGSTVTFQVFNPYAKAVTSPSAASTAVEAPPAPAPTVEVAGPETTSAGLSAISAQVACDRYAKEAFPLGYKPHWIIGRLAEEIRDDKWFLKIDADIRNASIAERSLEIECNVVGGTDYAIVESFNAY